MVRFADEALITVSSGKGGNGCIAFRREKYVPNGGPSGGDGGRGGDLVFEIRRNLRTLVHLRYKQNFRAKNGLDGQGNKRFGANGDDCVVPLPPGCVLKDADNGDVLFDFGESQEGRVVFLRGGNGGWGNVHFKGPANQAPRTALPGQPGETRRIRVEMNIIADIGFVGFPNAGKSTLLDYFTNARPKIAPYPFTTKIPNLGVLRVDELHDIVLADIPGIIEGASAGVGLGVRFLKHISRAAGLAFLIDLSAENYLDAYSALQSELEGFSKTLAEKKRVVIGTKIDLPEAKSRFAELKDCLQKRHGVSEVLGISVHERRGLEELKKAFVALTTPPAEGNPSEGAAARVFAADGKNVPGETGVPDFMTAELEDPEYDSFDPEHFGATISLSRKRRGKK